LLVTSAMHVHLATSTDVEMVVISSTALKQRKWCVVVGVCVVK